MDRLAAMRVFSEVALRGSFTAAADNLEMSRAKVTRHVKELESWLGCRLLQRSTRRISLTEAGESCLLRCQKMLELSDDLQGSIGQQNEAPRGQLRITTSMSFGSAHLASAVTTYLDQYPDVSIDLLIEDRSVNLIENRIDLAIRIAGELDPNMVARRIAPCRSVICASPDYLQRKGTPLVPSDIKDHNCLTYSNFGKGQWRFKKQGTEIDVPVSGNLSANEVMVLNQAAIAGAGISLQPTYLAGPLIQERKLTELLPDWEPPGLTIWGVYVSRHHIPATLRTFLDFLVKRFGGTPDWDKTINK